MNSGGVSVPRAIATGVAWVHMPPLEKPENEWVCSASSPFPFLHRR